MAPWPKSLIVLCATAHVLSFARDPLEYCIGADLSYLKMQEDRGIRFRDGDRTDPGLAIFRRHGYGWIRLRLFHTPSAHPDRMPNDLPYTIALAQQGKALGFKFLLDFHYSDSWADPGKQWPPAAWSGLGREALADSVYRYTRSAMAAFREAGVWPDMVQIGNEITPGMLWDHGRIVNDDFGNLADLLKAGVRGVDSARGLSPMPRIMLHLDRGGDWDVTHWWFGGIIAEGVPFDVIGQSYYPEWHGTLDDLRATFDKMGRTYAKDLILVETALMGPQAGFPLTNDGQARFLRAVDSVIRLTPNGRGKGVFWWEPTNSPGGAGSTRNFFDADWQAKPVIRVFDGQAIGISRSSGPAGTGIGKVGGDFIRPDGRRTSGRFRWWLPPIP